MENEVFTCSEESLLFSLCVQTLLLEKCPKDATVLEVGAGDGTPILRALHSCPAFQGKVHGYEITAEAFAKASDLAARAYVRGRYELHHASFFDANRPTADYVISSQPYIPAHDDDILLPGLWGGPNGDTVARQILDLGYRNALLLVPSYTKPKAFLRYAQGLGYKAVSFLASPMPFGTYSSEPKVMTRIQELVREGDAYVTENGYLVAGVLFSKEADAAAKDLSGELVKMLG